MHWNKSPFPFIFHQGYKPIGWCHPSRLELLYSVNPFIHTQNYDKVVKYCSVQHTLNPRITYPYSSHLQKALPMSSRGSCTTYKDIINSYAKTDLQLHQLKHNLLWNIGLITNINQSLHKILYPQCHVVLIRIDFRSENYILTFTLVVMLNKLDSVCNHSLT